MAEAARKGSKTATARLEALIFFFLLWLVLGFLFEFPAGEFKKKNQSSLKKEMKCKFSQQTIILVFFIMLNMNFVCCLVS